MVYKIGDNVRIICLTNNDMSLELIEAKERHSFTKKEVTEHATQIVGVHQMNDSNIICLCDFDPHSYFSFKIRDRQIKSHDVDDKFLNCKAAYINPPMIWVQPSIAATPQVNSHEPGGEWCAVCPKFIQYAAPNLPNNDFVCRSCRLTKMYKVNPYLRENKIDPSLVDWIKA